MPTSFLGCSYLVLQPNYDVSTNRGTPQHYSPFNYIVQYVFVYTNHKKTKKMGMRKPFLWGELGIQIRHSHVGDEIVDVSGITSVCVYCFYICFFWQSKQGKQAKLWES